MTFLTDTFTGSDGDGLAVHTGETGATWSVQTGGSGNSGITDANRLRCSGGGDGFYYAGGIPNSADYYVEAPVYVASVAGGYVGVCGRMSRSAATRYWAIYNRGAGNWELWSTVANTSAQLATSAATLTVGQTYTLRLDMVGSTIRLLVDGVEKISVTNTAIKNQGRAGVILNGSVTNSTGLHLTSITAITSSNRKTMQVICDGNSITYGTGATPGTSDYVTQLADLYPHADYGNTGNPGVITTIMTSNAVGNVDGTYPRSYQANVCVGWEATNDICMDATAQEAHDHMATYHAARRAAGWITVNMTILPRSENPAGWSLPVDKHANFNLRRAACNTLMRASRCGADYQYDIAADSRVGDDGDETDATYYDDLVHMTATGYTIPATGIAGILPAIASTTNASPMVVGSFIGLGF